MTRRVIRGLVLAVALTACGSDPRPEIAWVEGARDSATVVVAVSTCRAEGLSVDVVSEDAEVIRLRASASSEGSADECADSRDVRLAGPLGDRRVIDERSGNEVDVRFLDGS